MMDESEARSLLDVLAREPQPPSTIDVEQTVRRRSRRRRARRVAGAGVAAVVLVGGLGTAVVRTRTPDRDPSTSAPRTFSPTSRYASFGWLPQGFRATRLDLGTDKQTLTAASDNGRQITLTFVSRSLPPELVDTWNGRGVAVGPKVKGRSSVWITAPSNAAPIQPYVVNSGTPPAWRQQCQPPQIAIALDTIHPGRVLPNPLSLCWEYGRGVWATLTLPSAGVSGDRNTTALKIANSVRIGLDQPQRFPFRLRLPGVALTLAGGWVTGTEWTAEADDPRPPHTSRSLSRGLSVSVRIHGAADYNGYASPPDSTLDGYPAYQTGSEDTGEKLKNTLDVYGVHGMDIHLDSSGYTEDELRQIFRSITILGKGQGTTRPLG
jgi:hypothetical protein